MIACMLASKVGAETITVSNLNDSGTGSLRAALADAHENDTIVFSVSGTINLVIGELYIDRSLIIVGPSAGLVIDGGGLSRVAHIADGNVRLENLQIINGLVTTGNGGGIKAGPASTVNLLNSVVRNNRADRSLPDTSIGAGGGIYSEGVLIIENSIINNNYSSSGGGLYAAGASLVIKNSSFYSNSTGIDTNSNGGGLVSGFNTNSTISSSSFINNSAYTGGGIDAVGGVSVVNSTFYGNIAQGWGGGLYARNGTLVINSTFSGNSASSGGGINVWGWMTIKNSVLGNNGSGGDCVNSYPNNTDGSYNTMQSINSTCSLVNGVNENNFGLDPLLNSLSDNGCTVMMGVSSSPECIKTMSLGVGSPAIDTANADVCGGFEVRSIDERGFYRPTTSCDRGAYEKDALPYIQYALNVASVGNGSISSQPVGINCGSVCSYFFLENTEVTLIPVATSGQVFVRWEGACTGAGACILSMGSNKEVTAVFGNILPNPIPTLSEWAQIMMMLAMIATAGFYGWRIKQH
jgi:hypothetical protein